MFLEFDQWLTDCDDNAQKKGMHILDIARAHIKHADELVLRYLIEQMKKNESITVKRTK